MAETKGHWTNKSLDDFKFFVAFDFMDQIEGKFQELAHSDIAQLLGISERRVRQIIADHSLLTLDHMIKLVRKLGLKLAVVAYDDGDRQNLKGPIPAEYFVESWNRQGRPRSQRDLDKAKEDKAKEEDKDA